MMNFTVLSLNVLTFASFAPLYTIHDSYQLRSYFILNSYFSRSFTNIIFSNADHHRTIIKDDIFSHTLESAIVFSKDENEAVETKKVFKAKNFTSNNEFNNLGSFSSLYVANCHFIKCKTDSYGGGIYIHQECSVTLHELIFDKCTAKDGAGGYFCKVKNEPNENGEFHDESLSQINVQYCCFQNCYSLNNDASKTGFGSALVLAGQNIILFYASTTECATVDLTGNSISARGAHFDIQSSQVSSQFLNITGGKSKYCGSIEYRYSQYGFFKFQTIISVECMFVVAFSKFESPEVKIENCNLIKNTLCAYDQTAYTYPAMMKITQTDLVINNFIFLENNFNENGRIASCDGQTNDDDHRKDNQKITLNNCYSDSYPSHNDEKFTAQNCNFNQGKALTTNPIDQLNLGECKGDATVGTLIITAVFTPSFKFSKSDEFSKSFEFSESLKFSHSDDFSKSVEFSGSNDLFHSKAFTPSEFFSNSQKFSDSNIFVQPGDQSNSGNKLKPGAIAGIAVAAVAACAIIAVVAFFLIKKKMAKLPDDEDIETFDDSLQSTRNENPIYNAKAEDDPFKEDF